MNPSAYNKLLALLDSAKLTLADHAGSLSPADLRIRCLVNITAKEAQRAFLEESAASESEQRAHDMALGAEAAPEHATRHAVSP